MSHAVCLKYSKCGNLPKGSPSHASQLWNTSQGMKYFHLCYFDTAMAYQESITITHILQMRKLRYSVMKSLILVSKSARGQWWGKVDSFAFNVMPCNSPENMEFLS